MRQILRFSAMAAVVTAVTMPLPAQKASTTPEVFVTGVSWGVQSVSDNGRFLCGTRQYEEGYIYDTDNELLTLIKIIDTDSEMAILDVTDDGVGVGTNDNNMAAYYKDGKWIQFRNPRGTYHTGAVNQITPDGRVATGFLMGNSSAKPYNVFPMVWTWDEDEQDYLPTILPEPEKDFLGGKPQFVSPRAISDNGKRVVGVIVEEHGFAYQPIIYNYNEASGEWEYDMPFASFAFNAEKHQELWAQRPKITDYITVSATDPLFAEQQEQFLKAENAWEYKYDTEARTGKNFIAPPIVMNGVGSTLVSYVEETTYSYDPTAAVEEQLSSSSTTRVACYDINTGELTYIDKAITPVDITNDGDIIAWYQDTYGIYFAKTGEVMKLTDYLHDTWNFDLEDHMTTAGLSPQAISANGATLAGGAGNESNYSTFCVRLPYGMSSGIKTVRTDYGNGISVCNGLISFAEPAASIEVYNVSGQRVTAAYGVSEIATSDFAPGIYMLRATVDGENRVIKFINK